MDRLGADVPVQKAGGLLLIAFGIWILASI
jgi:hypothetical protein